MKGDFCPDKIHSVVQLQLRGSFTLAYLGLIPLHSCPPIPPYLKLPAPTARINYRPTAPLNKSAGCDQESTAWHFWTQTVNSGPLEARRN